MLHGKALSFLHSFNHLTPDTSAEDWRKAFDIWSCETHTGVPRNLRHSLWLAVLLAQARLNHKAVVSSAALTLYPIRRSFWALSRRGFPNLLAQELCPLNQSETCVP